jgi:hypothetical protein
LSGEIDFRLRELDLLTVLVLSIERFLEDNRSVLSVYFYFFKGELDFWF